jgi:acetyl-CoA C-acetyltransferase
MTLGDPIVIVGSARTPIGGFQGDLRDSTAPELGAAGIRAALDRSGIGAGAVEETVFGCVLPAAQGQASAGQAAIRAGLPFATGATIVNKMCGSGMKAVMLAHDLISAGSASIAVAGGMASMTNARFLLDRARGYRLGHGRVVDHMFPDGLEDAYDKGRRVGTFAEDCAEAEAGFSRKRYGDRCERVLHIRRRCRAGVDAALPAEREGIAPPAIIVGHSTHSQAPNLFATAPIGALRKLGERTGWSLQDVDLFEINEAFAVVAMAAMRDLDLPHDKVNVHGVACALGHPIGRIRRPRDCHLAFPAQALRHEARHGDALHRRRRSDCDGRRTKLNGFEEETGI